MEIKIIKKQTIKHTETVCKFKVGDLAVYPAHGVGLIEAIEEKVINGEQHDFYILKVIENGMVIMIPTWNVDQVGLRNVVDPDDIPKIYDVIQKEQASVADKQTWNRRYKEYMDKIKTGSIYDVAEVFRDLYHLKLTKDLSFGERKLFDTARVLLVTELSTARNVDEAEIKSEINSLFETISDENLSTMPEQNSS
ncbi:MAG: CarD family transcriptional regulator [Deltaproteobacteria bacterium]|nr:CarD family transcriptional regulator [Deltaproteobacteria bacterium]